MGSFLWLILSEDDERKGWAPNQVSLTRVSPSVIYLLTWGHFLNTESWPLLSKLLMLACCLKTKFFIMTDEALPDLSATLLLLPHFLLLPSSVALHSPVTSVYAKPVPFLMPSHSSGIPLSTPLHYLADYSFFRSLPRVSSKKLFPSDFTGSLPKRQCPQQEAQVLAHSIKAESKVYLGAGCF